MRFRIVIVLLVAFVGHSLYAQQQVLNHISNEYIIAANEQKILFAVNNLRNEIYKQFKGVDHPYQISEIDDYSSYFSFFYQNTKGYINIMFRNNEGRSITVEEDLDKYYSATLIDDDPNDYIIEYVKTSTIQGGVFFSKKSNSIYIFIRSQPKGDFMRATVMLNLTSEQKIAFAKDFIQKTKFK